MVEALWDELERAIDKHGFDGTPMSSKVPFDRKYRIIGEEFGEVSQAFDHGTREELLGELLQLTAMAAGTWLAIKGEEESAPRR